MAYTPEQFADAERFLKVLRQYRGILERKTILTLRGQALSGDIKGAQKGLEHALRKAGVIA